MSDRWSRRRFVSITSGLSALGFTGFALPGFAQSPAPVSGPNLGPETFPSHDPAVVREIVGVSHNNITRVRELVEKQPALARASIDWGFGDWEAAIDAASHVGRREIAEFLIANGARPTIFSAAMMGQLDVVKAFVAAAPGAQRIKGPHSITLLRHAMAGGPPAQAVVDYLQMIGGADEKPAAQPLSPADVARLTGAYTFGLGPGDRFEITATKDQLSIGRPGKFSRGLFHLGSFEFFPVGAERVRIRIAESASAMVLTIHDPDVVLTARKAM